MRKVGESGIMYERLTAVYVDTLISAPMHLLPQIHPVSIHHLLTSSESWISVHTAYIFNKIFPGQCSQKKSMRRSRSRKKFKEEEARQKSVEGGRIRSREECTEEGVGQEGV